MQQRPGFILWFTGMSGAGKSTLSTAVARQLSPVQRVELLDGDEVRTYLSRGLGFSREDREENVRRIGYVARVLARHEVGVITAAISPYKSSRDEVRALATQAGIPFLEVYVQASLEALIARDVKGLYKKALAGEIPHFTGVSDPYEPPEAPEIIVRSDAETVEAGLERILDTLRDRGLLVPAASAA
ncbi:MULTISPECIES: adenylyl-sulfate kinase [Corallococcus]|uniref:adenylyl-sulfate kinase n=1 Tax=Corallococcus TaxID=83461 RepID=UPI001180F10E|nr:MULTISPECIES: adenylyl-sulfate kinase [Corallococcus]NBD09300.1 adenylyl-sulfate kinase [Corallococcus silvisoli]TSC31268.1 adenylyl-sulfate kinase [Corallococcus sp. Z5C101001]